MRIAWTWTGCRLLLLRVVFVFRPLPLEWERCHRNLGAIKSSTRKACGPGPAGGGLPDEMANSPFSCLTFLLVCTLVWHWRTLAIDSFTTPVLKCIWLLRFLPFCFGFPSRCLMVWWFVGPGLLRFCAQLRLQMRIARGACFFCCRLCSLLALCPWKGNDVSETLEPPNTTPGRLADLDLLGVDFLTKWQTRLFVVWCSCWFAPWCGIGVPLLLIHSPHRVFNALGFAWCGPFALASSVGV